jgi:hypothetical protein
VVTVTGQILPSGGLIVLKTVGVVGGIVPDNQIVSDDIGLLGGGSGDAEESAGGEEHCDSQHQGEQFLCVVHWSTFPFRNFVFSCGDGLAILGGTVRTAQHYSFIILQNPLSVNGHFLHFMTCIWLFYTILFYNLFLLQN